MDKQLEYFDALANTQKQVFNNLLSAQKDLRVQWVDAISKTHAAFTSIPGLPETPQTKEALAQFETWFSTVADNSQTATDEALKLQDVSPAARDLAVGDTQRALWQCAHQ